VKPIFFDMIESVKIVGVMQDGSKKEVRTIPTSKRSVGGVAGFFDGVKEQYIQVMFDDRTFVTITEKKLKFLLDNDDNCCIIGAFKPTTGE